MTKKDDEKKKLKKQQKEEEAKAFFEIQQRVKDANAIRDLLEGYPAFRKFDRNGLNLEMGYLAGPELESETVDWALDLIESTMGDVYERCFGGFQREKKRELLVESDARFILFYPMLGEDFRGDPMGFIHFRFELEQMAPVLYIHEIVLEEPLRRKGLSLFMLKFLELVARRTNMEWLMTTVPNGMEDVVKLFGKVGYTYDPESPCMVYTDPATRPKNIAYEVVSKCLLPLELQQAHMQNLMSKNFGSLNAHSRQAQMKKEMLLMQ